MSRPLRLEQAGAVWHVTSRGNEKKSIFADDLDRQRWLHLLGRVSMQCAWNVHAYVLMENHYHLVIETLVPGLSRGMRQLNGIYTQQFNRRHARVGHLFQGRFHSVLVDKESHLLEVLRYVVLNPVRARMVDTAAEWPWSSYRATVGDAPAPAWLQTSWLLAHFGGSVQRYRTFVAEGRGVPSIWRHVRGQVYLGTDEFVHRALCRAEAHTHAEEVPSPQRVMRNVPPEAVAATVVEALGVPLIELQSRRRWLRERAILAYALRAFSRLTGPEAAVILKSSSWHASKLARTGEAYWRNDVARSAAIERRLRELKP